jgi:hypothetical protein
MASIVPPITPALIEPVPVAEEFVSGPAFLHTDGAVTLMVFYVDQILSPDSGMAQERRISHRLWMPMRQLIRLRGMIDAQSEPVWNPKLVGANH